MRVSFATAAPLILAIPAFARCQSPGPISIDSAVRIFAEAKTLCTAHAGKLWGVSRCGPIIFVDAPSRSIVASASDTKGALTAKDGAFIGVLPADQNVSNTAVAWNGITWTQMLCPLPNDERRRATVIAHEGCSSIAMRRGGTHSSSPVRESRRCSLAHCTLRPPRTASSSRPSAPRSTMVPR